MHDNCPAEIKELILHEHMTHNDFDYHDDIMKPLKAFIEKIKFSTEPTATRRTIELP